MTTKNHRERILAEALPTGIIMINHQNNIHWWNQIAGNLLKLDKKVHANNSITHVLQSEAFLRFYQQVNGQEIKIPSPVQPDAYLSIRLCPYDQDQKLLIVHDVTRTHRLEVMRQNFIANVSHELRTPLTVFCGYLEILHERDKLDEVKFNTLLKHMEAQSHRMEGLVRDLLLLSRLESDQPNPHYHANVPVAELIRTIAGDAQSLSGEMHHKIVLELDDALNMEGHLVELRSAFSNIIFNAVRYTPQNGMIKIQWYQDQHGKHFQVSDSGIGIEQKHIPHITQRFYRVDKSRTYEGKGGTGLGLAIVKHVLLRHQGELTIKSEPNVGSIFTCTFPNDLAS